MKIAFINQPWNLCPPPEMGSIAIWTYQVVRRLHSRHDIVVYARKRKQDHATERLDGVTYRRFPIELDLRLIGLLERLGINTIFKVPLFASHLYYWLYARRVAKDLAQQGCEIVHVQNLSQFVPVIKKYNPGVKIVLHMHCEWLTQLDKNLVTRRFEQIDAVLGCSDYIRQLIARAYPDFSKKTYTVYNGVDTTALLRQTPQATGSRTDHAAVVLFVGRITPEKGLHILLQAFKRVLQNIPEARLRIVGPEAITPKQFIVDVSASVDLSHLEKYYERSYLEILQETAEADLPGKVEFVGKVAHGNLPEHYQAADVLVNPSFSESFGMTLIEAMTFSLPVVATSVGGMTEIVEQGQTGYLVKPGEVEALAEAIQSLLQNQEQAGQFGEAGRQRALQRFSWEAVADRLDEVYRQLDMPKG